MKSISGTLASVRSAPATVGSLMRQPVFDLATVGFCVATVLEFMGVASIYCGAFVVIIISK